MFFKKIQKSINLRRFFSVNIPLKKLQVTTSRSSGPGGQSVNKSETKVQIRFNVQSADWLTEDLKDKFLIVNKAKITQKGDFIVECDGSFNGFLLNF
ncbi:uncharacterized protein TA17965 [Theileria annulata]|uniref:RF-1 domain containing protein, putative n=1 Tax=Theileria annulata TaxID=5874 RepID=Q4UB56_THEAN|nr:uncharacterized protein TA17965 [Theileria annulata]CAI75945.1 hypothetical protein TA17965 [Theileria annulata]|eukprot:XP_955421.1 hypothetical protein TA17965 [Theileria annulata]